MSPSASILRSISQRKITVKILSRMPKTACWSEIQQHSGRLSALGESHRSYSTPCPSLGQLISCVCPGSSPLQSSTSGGRGHWDASPIQEYAGCSMMSRTEVTRMETRMMRSKILCWVSAAMSTRTQLLGASTPKLLCAGRRTVVSKGLKWMRLYLPSSLSSSGTMLSRWALLAAAKASFERSPSPNTMELGFASSVWMRATLPPLPISVLNRLRNRCAGPTWGFPLSPGASTSSIVSSSSSKPCRRMEMKRFMMM
mmetsp:Transcript_8880/g.23169  ORF Transcript_8880/g.23169 Transcript_8880/m.23169 type:complete len:256 (+) Transcript_8880:2336-3103(+)